MNSSWSNVSVEASAARDHTADMSVFWIELHLDSWAWNPSQRTSVPRQNNQRINTIIYVAKQAVSVAGTRCWLPVLHKFSKTKQVADNGNRLVHRPQKWLNRWKKDIEKRGGHGRMFWLVNLTLWIGKNGECLSTIPRINDGGHTVSSVKNKTVIPFCFTIIVFSLWLKNISKYVLI